MININLHQLIAMCSDYKNVENYDKAINDKEYKWELHHRLESHFSNGESRGTPNNFILKSELIALDMYYDRPASELIFLRYDEHRRLHFKGLKRPQRTKEHLEKIAKGRQKAIEKGCYRNNKFHKPFTPSGMKWFTNGEEDIFAFECPKGFKPGRSKIKGRKQTEEEKLKRSKAYDKSKHPASFKLTDQQRQNLSFAKLRYYGRLR